MTKSNSERNEPEAIFKMLSYNMVKQAFNVVYAEAEQCPDTWGIFEDVLLHLGLEDPEDRNVYEKTKEK